MDASSSTFDEDVFLVSFYFVYLLSDGCEEIAFMAAFLAIVIAADSKAASESV